MFRATFAQMAKDRGVQIAPIETLGAQEAVFDGNP
jgi:hypothetical protein